MEDFPHEVLNSMRLAALLLALTRAFELPRIHPEATSLLSDGKWWAQVNRFVACQCFGFQGIADRSVECWYGDSCLHGLLHFAAKWKVGDHVVHTPHASSGLSTNIGNYYYAYGKELSLARASLVSNRQNQR